MNPLTNLSKKSKLFIAIGIQLLILGSILVYKLIPYATGTEVLLKIQPYDPRSPLRGDYVTFRYDISQITNYHSIVIYNGNDVYIPLRKNDKYWIVDDKYPISTTPPQQGSLFIKGTVVSGGLEKMNSIGDPYPYQRVKNSTLSINYGIEDYFIPEGKGQNFTFANHEVGAKVAVDKNGNAALKKLYVDGSPWP